MPKENISRAINKSEITNDKNFENLRYEGFGPFNTAFIVETLTDNKNRSASSIRTVLQKMEVGLEVWFNFTFIQSMWNYSYKN